MKSTCLITLVFLVLIILFQFDSSGQDVPPEYKKYFYHYQEESTKDKVYNFLEINKLKGRSFALIAGVSKYPAFSSDKTLKPAAIDVQRLKTYLKKYEHFDEIIVLENEAFNDDNLKFFLQGYFVKALEGQNNSRFLFAYSGHGFAEPNADEGYLVQSHASHQRDAAHSINMQILKIYLRTTTKRAHHSLVLLNACNSGNFLDRPFGLPLYLPSKPGALAIVSSSEDQLSWGNPEKGSVFFDKFFAGLDGLALSNRNNGIVTTTELHSYIKREVAIAKNNAQNVPPVGDLSEHGSKGEFFFLNRDKLVSAGKIAQWTDEIWKIGFGIEELETLVFDEVPEEPIDEIFVIAEEEPLPPGGKESFKNLISSSMNYPEEAKAKGIEGNVIFTFIVEKDGTISNLKIVRGLGAGCDEEALRLLTLKTKWTPAKQRGRPVKYRMHYAINFGLPKPILTKNALLDTRDNKMYKQVTIGDQVWMAQNLNYDIPDQSFCYNDSESNCDKYGRLYTHEAAMKACPLGWHLPSVSEWQELSDFVRKEYGNVNEALKYRSFLSKEENTHSGFNAHYAGGSFPNQPGKLNKYKRQYFKMGDEAIFWTSTNSTLGNLIREPYVWAIGNNTGSKVSPKTSAYSCRCIRDD